MKTSPSRAIDPALVDEISRLFASGCSHDDAIDRMRKRGLYKVDSIRLLRELSGLSLHDAKDVVHLSPVWADRHDFDEALHDVAEAALALEMKEERTAA